MSHQAEEFFAALYAKQTGVLELRTFDHPDAKRLRKFVPVHDGQFDFTTVDRFLKETEQRKLGAFFGVALRTESAARDEKGDADHCQSLSSLFVDTDFKHLGEDEARRRIDAFPVKPSAIVESGGGLHPYWMLRFPIFLQATGGMQKAKDYLQAMASTVADIVDTSVSEPVRVLRIPGSFNFKKQYDTPRPVAWKPVAGGTYELSVFEPFVAAYLAAQKERDRTGFKIPDEIRSGDRHEILYKFLRSQKARGVSEKVAIVGCHALNEEQCKPPIARADLDAYLKRVWHQPDSQGFQPPTPSHETKIVIAAGEMETIVNAAENALLKEGRIFQRAGFLTRVILPTKHDLKVLRRDPDSTMLGNVTENWLLEQMSRAAEWRKHVAKGGQMRSDPPAIYAKTLMERLEWKFPVIRAIIKAPTLTADGRILQQPGFDEPSGLYLDIPKNYFLPVAEHPTIDDALTALRILEHPLRGFPFVDDASRSVAVSAILTGLIRGSLRTAPLIAFDAPAAGTGKSLLAELIGIVIVGTEPPAMPQGRSEEEDEKRLIAALLTGTPVLHIDNCNLPIHGTFLCSVLTQPVVMGRILGKTELRTMPSVVLILASGNQLVLTGDMPRRAAICHLDAKVEFPNQREFDFDCHAEAKLMRPQLVHAALTILRAYDIAGRPVKLKKPMGSFPDWDWVRGSLVWLGCADPRDTQDDIVTMDVPRNELVTVMELWAAQFGTAWTDVATIGEKRETEPYHSALAVQLIEAACSGRDGGGKWNSKSVGWWLRRHKGRVVNGCRFEAEDHEGKQRWRLVGVSLDG